MFEFFGCDLYNESIAHFLEMSILMKLYPLHGETNLFLHKKRVEYEKYSFRLQKEVEIYHVIL